MAIMFTQGGTACTSNRGSSNKGFIQTSNTTLLQKLDISNADVGPRGMRPIARFSNLKELTIFGAVSFREKT